MSNKKYSPLIDEIKEKDEIRKAIDDAKKEIADLFDKKPITDEKDYLTTSNLFESSYSKKVINDYLNEKPIHEKTLKESYEPETSKKSLNDSHINDLVTFKDTQKMVRFGKMNLMFGADKESTGFGYIAENERERYKWWAMFNRVQSFMVYDLTTV